MQQFKGLPASEGIGIGPAWVYRPSRVAVERRQVTDTDAEWRRFQIALSMSLTQLQALEARARDSVGEDEAAIFSAHQMFLDDEELINNIQTRIMVQRLNGEAAVHEGFEYYAIALQSLEDEYFKARAADVRDVEQRILRCLGGGGEQDDAGGLAKPSIILAEDLTPSDTIQFDRSLILGIATVKGGPTSHTAILSRSFGVPAVVSVPFTLDDIDNGLLIIMDGASGDVILGPTLGELSLAKERQAKWLAERDVMLSAAKDPAVTKDGRTVEVVANIGSVDDARLSIENGAEGVGLLRTEFLYLDRDSLPVEAEQAKLYAEVFKIMEGRPVVVRTLDIGGDKSVSYLGLQAEPNPFLGWRAIRMIRERPDVLQNQLRALLIAGGETNADLRIMLPMVSSLQEVQRAREIYDEAREQLVSQDVRLPEKVQFGIMVEVPSTAVQADDFAQVVDFFSIGTNDLTQYTLAIDRTNERVAALASPYNPAVLRLIKMTIDAAHQHGKWVGLCGELGGDMMAVPLLLGMGLDEFSMGSSSIPAVKQAIRTWTMTGAREVSSETLKLPTVNLVVEYLKAQKPR